MFKHRKPIVFCSSFSVAILVCLFLATVAFCKEINWKMTTTWTPAIDLIEADKHFIKLVDQLSEGKINIKLHTAGELVSAFESFGAVQTGTLDAGGDWPNYWSGKNRAFDALGSYPMGLTAIDYAIWIYQYGGLKKYQKVYGKYGMYYLPHSVTPMESGLRSNEPIKSLEDYKGLKVRMSGKTQGEILNKLGCSQTMLSGGEVYQALEKGVIDAAEFSSPSNDWRMGLNEVTKYWATPGWHQPASVLGVMINKNSWENLSKHQKMLLKKAAMANFLWSYTYFQKGAAESTHKFLNTGTKVNRLNEEELNKIQSMANKATIKTAQNNKLFAEIIYDQLKYLQKMSKWREISQPFTIGRNIKLPNMKKLKKAANE